MGLLASLTFGSLISATDPVTVLAVFQSLGVKVDLFSMVFGESVLNDAVAIVLSRTLLSFKPLPPPAPATDVDADDIVAALLLFVTIFIGSMVIGVLAGIISSLVFKALNLKQQHDTMFLETALSFVFPWAAYFIAEAQSLSGIVSILFCGIMMATYTKLNFSQEARVLTARGFKSVAFIAETFVFVYLGMAVFTFPIFKNTVWTLVLIALLACFLGRLHIYLGSWLTNCFRRGERKEGQLPKISNVYMFIMWFSGLRGGVAFALASVSFQANDFPMACGGLAGKACEWAGMYDSLAILQTTMLIALFTIFVFGGSITSVAVAGGVLEKGTEKAEEPTGNKAEWDAFLLCMLTRDEHHWHERSLRSQDSMTIIEGEGRNPEGGGYSETTQDDSAELKETSSTLTTGEFKKVLRERGSGHVEHAYRTVGEHEDIALEDKLDEMRHYFPGQSSDALKRMLDAAGGDVQRVARSAGKSGIELTLL